MNVNVLSLSCCCLSLRASSHGVWYTHTHNVRVCVCVDAVSCSNCYFGDWVGDHDPVLLLCVYVCRTTVFIR